MQNRKTLTHAIKKVFVKEIEKLLVLLTISCFFRSNKVQSFEITTSHVTRQRSVNSIGVAQQCETISGAAF